MPSQPRYIVDRLMVSANVKTFADLARYLEVQPPAINAALRSKQIPETWIYKIAYRTGRRVEYLLRGEQPEFRDEVAEQAANYTRSPLLPQIAEALEEMDQAERETLLLCADALRRGDEQVKHHLIGQLQIIRDAVNARKGKYNKGDPAKRKRDAVG